MNSIRELTIVLFLETFNFSVVMVKMEDELGYLRLIDSFANVQQINKSPPMYIIEDFLSHEECEWLIGQAEPLL